MNDFKLKKSKIFESDHMWVPTNIELREVVDLREWDSIIEDQGYLGSCTGNASTNAYELLVKQQYPDFFVELSRLFVYYNSRLIEGETAYDAGSTIKDSIQSLHIYGVCTEKLWPYIPFNVNHKPTEECYVEGLHRAITSYQYLESINDLLDVLNNNIPIVIGIIIYDNFSDLNNENYIVQTSDDILSGSGHALTLVGYDLNTKQFLAKNSFGRFWGLNGYCYIPFSYMEEQLIDAWCFTIPNQQSNLLLS